MLNNALRGASSTTKTFKTKYVKGLSPIQLLRLFLMQVIAYLLFKDELSIAFAMLMPLLVLSNVGVLVYYLGVLKFCDSGLRVKSFIPFENINLLFKDITQINVKPISPYSQDVNHVMLTTGKKSYKIWLERFDNPEEIVTKLKWFADSYGIPIKDLRTQKKVIPEKPVKNFPIEFTDNEMVLKQEAAKSVVVSWKDVKMIEVTRLAEKPEQITVKIMTHTKQHRIMLESCYEDVLNNLQLYGGVFAFPVILNSK